jgi:hypothetical protein
VSEKRHQCRAKAGIAAILWGSFFVSPMVLAAPIQYQFTVTSLTEIRGVPDHEGIVSCPENCTLATTEQMLFSPTDSITGSFFYDPDAPANNLLDPNQVTGVTTQPPIANISGSIAGYSFTVNGGFYFFSNDALEDGTTGDPNGQDVLVGPIDLFNSLDLTGFNISDNTDDFVLDGVLMYFREGETGSDFFDTTWPDTLPPAGADVVEMRLRFIQTNALNASDAQTQEVIGVMSLNAVPIPASIWLFATALGMLGWMKRRKTI